MIVSCLEKIRFQPASPGLRATVGAFYSSDQVKQFSLILASEAPTGRHLKRRLSLFPTVATYSMRFRNKRNTVHMANFETRDLQLEGRYALVVIIGFGEIARRKDWKTAGFRIRCWYDGGYFLRNHIVNVVVGAKGKLRRDLCPFGDIQT